METIQILLRKGYVLKNMNIRTAWEAKQVGTYCNVISYSWCFLLSGLPEVNKKKYIKKERKKESTKNNYKQF